MDSKSFDDEVRELRLGFIRYEKLRKLNPRQFSELYEKNIKEDKRFDELVDELEV